MASQQPVTDPSQTIHDFVVYQTDGGWLAVHKEDPAIVIERADWRQLHFACIGARVRRSLFDNYSSGIDDVGAPTSGGVSARPP